MAAYFETHKQRMAQWGRVRRHGAKPSGVIVIHTAESATDFTGADSGAESVARYFCNASRYASYHVICDADSTIQLVPWASEAWHDTGTNNHSVGISGAIQCKHWDELEGRGERIVKRMAQAAADYADWLEAKYGIDVPARKISRTQSRNRVPGFLAHGTSDPGRRTDPGSEFDWDLFLAEYTKARGGIVAPVGSVKPKPGGKGAWTRKPDGRLMSEAPKSYGELFVDGDFEEVSVGALQILLYGAGYRNNEVWDGDDGTRTWKDVQELLANTGFLDTDKWLIDGKPEEETIKALQRMLAKRGFLDTDKWLIDGKFQTETKKAFQRYLNARN